MFEFVNILLVENDRAVSGEIREYLQDLGCDVSVSTKGEEAILKFKRNHYDLIIMDIELDGRINGIETIERIVKLDEYRGQPYIYNTVQSHLYDDAVKTSPAAWFEKKGGFDGDPTERQANIMSVIKNVQLFISRSKLPPLDVKQDNKIIHVKSADGFKRAIDRKNVVAVEYDNGLSLCFLHLNENGKPKAHRVDYSLVQLCKTLGINSLKRISNSFALNLTVQYYDSHKEMDGDLWIRMRPEYFKPKKQDVHRGLLQVSRTYKKKVKEYFINL